MHLPHHHSSPRPHRPSSRPPPRPPLTSMLATDPPWPLPTPTPTYPHRNRLLTQRLRPFKRQQDVDQDLDCNDVGNNVLSCAPVAGQTVVQNTSMHFVWNKNQPSFSQFNLVDVYLFHEDSLKQAANKTHLQNQAGRVAFDVNDQWWGAKGDSWSGHNISYPMYFIIVPGGQALTGAEIPQATFTAIQTRVPDSVLAQQVAASSSASLASISSEASASRSSSSSGSPNPTQSPASGLQSNSGGDSFPKWALALLVILGVLALLAFLLAFYFLSQHLRRKRQRRSRPDSMGSSTPIMTTAVRADSQREPLVKPSAEPISPILESSHGHGSFLPPPVIQPDRARSIATSTNTRDTGADLHSASPETAHLMSSYRDPPTSQHSGTEGTSSGGVPFSGADAEIMAAAFREKLRKPDFADRPLEEGESPEAEGKDDVLERELAEEGRDLRSVNSSRVRVEGDEGEVGTLRGDRHHHHYSNSDLPSVDSG